MESGNKNGPGQTMKQKGVKRGSKAKERTQRGKNTNGRSEKRKRNARKIRSKQTIGRIGILPSAEKTAVASTR
eukprot:3812862-Pleurochrysis_carterae.AAC.1